MDMFQIVEITEEFHHAGTKATADISVIAERLGFQKIPVHMSTIQKGKMAKLKRQIGYFYDWNDCYNIITDYAVVLLQHPFHHYQCTREFILKKLKNKKHVKFISIVHDIEELRAFRYNNYYKHEFEMMIYIADVFIVHNKVMKQFFIEKGIAEEKLVILGIFDYLQEVQSKEIPHFEKSITVAGNLDTTKCAYISHLGELSDIKINLYGINFNKDLEEYKNIVYNGSFPANEIPTKLVEGFGLVWDGESINGCKGMSGQYLRYNNPHKLSLYLSSKLPVIIWKEAAEAEFVENNGIGILVESLKELEKVFAVCDNKQYEKFIYKVSEISRKLTNGWYTKNALNIALKIIDEIRG